MLFTTDYEIMLLQNIIISLQKDITNNNNSISSICRMTYKKHRPLQALQVAYKGERPSVNVLWCLIPPITWTLKDMSLCRMVSRVLRDILWCNVTMENYIKNRSCAKGDTFYSIKERHASLNCCSFTWVNRGFRHYQTCSSRTPGTRIGPHQWVKFDCVRIQMYWIRHLFTTFRVNNTLPIISVENGDFGVGPKRGKVAVTDPGCFSPL